MSFIGSGAGTSENPYRVETVAHVQDIKTGGFVYEVQNDIDMNGEAFPYLNPFTSLVKLNGKRISNAKLSNDPDTGGIFVLFGGGASNGGFENGTLHFDFNSGVNEHIFLVGGSIYVFRRLKIEGLLQTNGDVEIIRAASGSAIISDIHISANLTSYFNNNCVIIRASGSFRNYKKIIFTGIATSSSSDNNFIYQTNGHVASSCFYDKDKNPQFDDVKEARGYVVGKTEAELKQLATFTDFATDGLGYPLDGTGTVTADTNVITMSADPTGRASVGDQVKIGLPAEVRTITAIDATTITVDTNFVSGYTDEFVAIERGDDLYDMVNLGDYVDQTWAIQDGVNYPALSFELLKASGIITDDGEPVEGAVVDFYSIAAALGETTFVERVTTGADGRAQMTKPYNSALGYQGVAQWEEVADSGTATGGNVEGTTLEHTGKDPAWTNNQFGGADKKFMLKITAGTNSGEERTIISNTADTITVNRAFTAAIDNTSVYEVVELKGGLTKYFPPQS